jgi:type IV pilus assembly protein PilB
MAETAVSKKHPSRLGDWLIEEGHVTPNQLDLALREQKRKGGLLGEMLVELGFVREEVLAGFLAFKTRSEKVDLLRTRLSPEVVRLLPADLARRLVAIPLGLEDDLLTVAIADPLNVVAFDTIEQATGLKANLVAAAEGEILEAIERLYASNQSVEEILDELLKLGTERLASTTEKDAPMIRLVDRILGEAVQVGASDIHVHPEEKIVRVRYRTDGLLQAGHLMPKEIQPALIARFKILGRMDIGENRRPQGGRCSVVVGGRDIGLRLSSLPTSFGESIVARILNRSQINLNLAGLGLGAELEGPFRKLLDRPHGIILVTGPTGSGKTTTLYTALAQIDANRKSIFTLEDPVEYQLTLVRQTQVNEGIGLTFAEGLRTLLRQDPDVILVGETRDRETAQLMVRAALTGHLVFSTLHTNDAVGAVPRLVDLGVEPYLLAPTLQAVLGQRLVRRLCPECRLPVENAESVLRSLGVDLPPERPLRLWRAGGCGQCQNTGYQGRVGIHELLLVEPSFYAAMVPRVDVPGLQAMARAQGFRSLYEDGVSKAMQGVTSLEEVVRVTQQ